MTRDITFYCAVTLVLFIYSTRLFCQIILLFLLSIAIRDCWASTVQNIRDSPIDGTDDDSGGVDFDINGATVNGVAQVHKTVKFYEAMCPKFGWAAPIYGTSGNNAGEVTPVGVDTNLEVTLRQFAFNDGTGTLTSGFFYHCQVSIFILVPLKFNVGSSFPHLVKRCYFCCLT